MTKCPVCQRCHLGKGKRVDFTDLARVVIYIYNCKSCGVELWYDDKKQLIKTKMG